MLLKVISLENGIITDTQVVRTGDAFLFSPRRVRIRLAPLTMQSEVKFISARLRCGTSFPLFSLSLEELRDRPISLNDMALKHAFPELLEVPFNGLVSQLERWLISMLDQHLTAVPHMTQAANRLYYGADLSTVRERLALNPRTMERRIRHFIGVDARYFCRTARFQHTLRQILSGQDVLDSALAHGYTDQSHFIKTCRFFTGLTPNQLLTEQYRGLNCYIYPEGKGELG